MDTLLEKLCEATGIERLIDTVNLFVPRGTKRCEFYFFPATTLEYLRDNKIYIQTFYCSANPGYNIALDYDLNLLEDGCYHNEDTHFKNRFVHSVRGTYTPYEPSLCFLDIDEGIIGINNLDDYDDLCSLRDPQSSYYYLKWNNRLVYITIEWLADGNIKYYYILTDLDNNIIDYFVEDGCALQTGDSKTWALSPKPDTLVIYNDGDVSSVVIIKVSSSIKCSRKIC